MPACQRACRQGAEEGAAQRDGDDRVGLEDVAGHLARVEDVVEDHLIGARAELVEVEELDEAPEGEDREEQASEGALEDDGGAAGGGQGRGGQKEGDAEIGPKTPDKGGEARPAGKGFGEEREAQREAYGEDRRELARADGDVAGTARMRWQGRWPMGVGSRAV